MVFPVVSQQTNISSRLSARLSRRPDVCWDTNRHTKLIRMFGVVSLSLLCHAILIGLLAAVTWSIVGGDAQRQREYHVRLLAQPAQAENQGHRFRFPGEAHLDQPAAHQRRDDVEDLASLLKNDSTASIEPMEADESDLQTLAVNPLRRTDVVGATTTDAGDISDGFGTRDLTGGGPVGSMWGVGKGQRARSIVYVMDRSGSMGESFVLLKRELKHALGSLEPDQLFNLIWFNEGRAKVWSSRMRKASFANKRAAFMEIDQIIPSGQTDPLDAVRGGLGFRPDVVFLLSDGEFGEYNNELVKMIKSYQRKKRTVINTILFVYDTMGGGGNVLRTIAEMTHGTYKHVTEQDISRR